MGCVPILHVPSNPALLRALLTLRRRMLSQDQPDIFTLHNLDIIALCLHHKRGA